MRYTSEERQKYIDELKVRAKERRARESGHQQPAKQAIQPDPTQQRLSTELSWFQRHLNGTIILFSLGFRLLGFIMAINLAETQGYTSLEGLYCIVGIITGLLICGWVLRQKNRSLLWLVLFFVPLGWFVFLGLENKSDMTMRPDGSLG